MFLVVLTALLLRVTLLLLLLTCRCVAVTELLPSCVLLRVAVAFLAEAVVRLLYLGSPAVDVFALPVLMLDGLEYP